jgi:hypothetical protein
MGSTKLIVAGGVVAVVAAAALLMPSLAFGQPVAAVLPGSVAVQDAGDPGDGEGKAWGHHKDSPEFPGQGKGLDKNSGDFPGQGKGLDKDHGNPHDDD